MDVRCPAWCSLARSLEPGAMLPSFYADTWAILMTSSYSQAVLKKRLRNAGFGFTGLCSILAVFLWAVASFGKGMDSDDGHPSLVPCIACAGCCGILLIVFLACGYANRDLFNPDLTPYVVGCGAEFESIGAYSVVSVDSGTALLFPTKAAPPSPAASNTMCAGCLDGTAGECKQAGSSTVCVAIAAGNICPATFTACPGAAGAAATTQELDSGIDELAMGGGTLPALFFWPTPEPEGGLSDGAIAGIVIGSIFGFLACYYGMALCLFCIGVRKLDRLEEQEAAEVKAAASADAAEMQLEPPLLQTASACSAEGKLVLATVDTLAAQNSAAVALQPAPNTTAVSEV